MSALLGAVESWHWFLLGVALMIAESLFPGAFMLWFGIGAVLTGLVLFLVPDLGWQVQLMLFATASVASLLAWRRCKAAHPVPESHPDLNQRGRSYLGRRFTLEQPIVDGIGRLKVDDGVWRIAGEDLAAGTRIEVVGVEGTMLRVVRVG